MQSIRAKTILSKLRRADDLFGITYNMNVYRGCAHGCVYCDTRSACYGVGDLSAVRVKANALELLEKELRVRPRGTVGTGSMNDPYMPAEGKLRLVRRALESLARHRFPVHVITKSDRVVRDADVLQDLSSVYAAVSFTVTTADNDLAERLEPGAPAPAARLAAMERLAAAGIYTGVTMMPLLPFITDTEENVREVLRRAAAAGASYALPMFGVTLRKGSREFFYRALDRDFPGARERYEAVFGDRYLCLSPQRERLNTVFRDECARLGLAVRMRFYQKEGGAQLSLF